MREPTESELRSILRYVNESFSRGMYEPQELLVTGIPFVGNAGLEIENLFLEEPITGNPASHIGYIWRSNEPRFHKSHYTQKTMTAGEILDFLGNRSVYFTPSSRPVGRLKEKESELTLKLAEAVSEFNKMEDEALRSGKSMPSSYADRIARLHDDLRKLDVMSERNRVGMFEAMLGRKAVPMSKQEVMPLMRMPPKGSLFALLLLLGLASRMGKSEES